VAPRSLAALERQVDACRACPLWPRATQAVAGEGPARARLLLVGEQPGDEEDREGEPFVGPDELEIVDPAVVVARGATAGQSLLGPSFRVGAARGSVIDLDGRAVIGTIHPSAVLRNRDHDGREAAFAGLVDDLVRARELAA
jgi:DNA polymerase